MAPTATAVTVTATGTARLEMLAEHRDREDAAQHRVGHRDRGQRRGHVAGLERALVQEQPDGRHREQHIELPVPEDLEHAVVEEVDRRLGQHGGESVDRARRHREIQRPARAEGPHRQCHQGGGDQRNGGAGNDPRGGRSGRPVSLRRADGHEQREPAGDRDGRNPLVPGDACRVTDRRQRECEQQPAHEQRRHCDHGPGRERARLQGVRADVERDAEQPERPAREREQERRSQRQFGSLLRRDALLQHGRAGVAEAREQREHDRHVSERIWWFRRARSRGHRARRR